MSEWSYRAVGFERGGVEVIRPIAARNEAEAWAALMPPGFLLLRLERSQGDGWRAVTLSEAALSAEVEKLFHKLVALPSAPNVG